jgi:hypothetical protein
MAIASFPITGDGQGRFSLKVTSSDSIGAGSLANAVKLHDLIVLKLEGIDEKHHLGRIGIDQNNIWIKGIVDKRGKSDRLILTERKARDGIFIFPAILSGFCPDDGPKGSILINLWEVSQTQDGGTLREDKIVEICSNSPVIGSDNGDQLTQSHPMLHSSKKRNFRKHPLLF